MRSRNVKPALLMLRSQDLIKVAETDDGIKVGRTVPAPTEEDPDREHLIKILMQRTGEWHNVDTGETGVGLYALGRHLGLPLEAISAAIG